jgi:hypothetical protein
MAHLNYYTNPVFPLLDIPNDLAGSYCNATNKIFVSPHWQNRMSDIDHAIETAQQPMDWALGDDTGGSSSQSTLQPSWASYQPFLTHQQSQYVPIYQQGGNIMNQLLATYHHTYPAPTYN